MFSRDRDRPVAVVVLRACVGLMALVLIPPFVILAVVPMMLLLLPVAFVVLPFMICAFAGEAFDSPGLMRFRSSFPPYARARTVYPRLVRSLPDRRPNLRPVLSRAAPTPIATSPADSRRFAKDR